MKCVIDTSVSIKWILREDRQKEARLLLISPFERYAPDLLFIEAANAMRKKLRNNEITREQAVNGLKMLPDCFLSITTTVHLLPHAFELGVEIDHPVQDCCFLAAALHLDIPLVTDDTRFIVKSGRYRSNIIALADIASNSPSSLHNH